MDTDKTRMLIKTRPSGRLSVERFFAISLALILLASGETHGLSHQPSRLKRQVSIQTQPGSTASAGATAGVLGGTGGSGPSVRIPIDSNLPTPTVSLDRPANPAVASKADSLADTRPEIGLANVPNVRLPVQIPEQQPKRKPSRVTPMRPPSETYYRPRDDQVDEYCEDDGEDDIGGPYDYHSMFQMAAQPMRHVSDMMTRIFERMPTVADDGLEYGGSGNYASASALGDSDGFSRVASSVTNNGRTRGIVSETRNGRTKTRRIGGGADEEGEDYF